MLFLHANQTGKRYKREIAGGGDAKSMSIITPQTVFIFASPILCGTISRSLPIPNPEHGLHRPVTSWFSQEHIQAVLVPGTPWLSRTSNCTCGECAGSNRSRMCDTATILVWFQSQGVQAICALALGSIHPSPALQRQASPCKSHV